MSSIDFRSQHSQRALFLTVPPRGVYAIGYCRMQRVQK